MESKRRDTRFFEKWAARNCMKPICIVRDPEGDILLADSVEPIRTLGVYRTGYAIHRDGLEYANHADYDMSEFVLYSAHGGVQKRVNEALAVARRNQAMLKQSGFYDAEKKRSFSQQPD